MQILQCSCTAVAVYECSSRVCTNGTRGSGATIDVHTQRLQLLLLDSYAKLHLLYLPSNSSIGGYFYNAGDAMRHYPAFSTAMELTAKAALYSDLLSNKFIGRAPSTYLLPVNDALSKVAGELGKAPAGGLPRCSSKFCWNFTMWYTSSACYASCW